MEKSKFLTLLKKSLELKKLDEKDKLNLDSLNLLQIVEFNNKYFKKLKFNSEKVSNCKSVKEILKLYKII
jgi:acyl carrier protein|tara:strand:- start:302 stop:511 length:210 start_codon:yes stop_codon:yes gene_type:complete